LVAEKDRQFMLAEIFRTLKPGGRVAISDIVSDEHVPAHLKADKTLWSGCISGAFQEEAFMQAFLDAGFIAVTYDKWDAEPWQVVEGIEFRSVTLTAVKPSEIASDDLGQAVIYKGPFKEVYDDAGRAYPRGQRVAVSARFFDRLTNEPYADQFIGIEPAQKPETPTGFCKASGSLRPASETKGGVHTGEADGGCC
jgi:SAM-dependent methyltransferase